MLRMREHFEKGNPSHNTKGAEIGPKGILSPGWFHRWVLMSFEWIRVLRGFELWVDLSSDWIWDVSWFELCGDSSSGWIRALNGFRRFSLEPRYIKNSVIKNAAVGSWQRTSGRVAHAVLLMFANEVYYPEEKKPGAMLAELRVKVQWLWTN